MLSHKPEGATKTIAWVGKGIVYDTGGLSIKDKVCSERRDGQKYAHPLLFHLPDLFLLGRLFINLLIRTVLFAVAQRKFRL